MDAVTSPSKAQRFMEPAATHDGLCSDSGHGLFAISALNLVTAQSYSRAKQESELHAMGDCLSHSAQFDCKPTPVLSGLVFIRCTACIAATARHCGVQVANGFQDELKEKHIFCLSAALQLVLRADCSERRQPTLHKAHIILSPPRASCLLSHVAPRVNGAFIFC